MLWHSRARVGALQSVDRALITFFRPLEQSFTVLVQLLFILHLLCHISLHCLGCPKLQYLILTIVHLAICLLCFRGKVWSQLYQGALDIWNGCHPNEGVIMKV